ncbi:MAG: MFS transporter, partial [Gilvibacter sp.]
MQSNTHQKTNWLTLGLCFVTTILEGLDLQSMGVAATGLVAEFNLQSDEMGLIASASSVGLLIGALVGGMISDRIGRKQVMIISVALFGLCSLLTPFAWDVNSLIGIRLITGLGMGGALPMIIAIAAEAVKPSQRAGAVTMMYCATPIGGFIATAVVMLTDDWRQIFYVGGIAPLLLVPVLIKFLTESEAFKNVKETALQDKVASNNSLGHTLFAERRAVPTFMLWLGFLCSVGVLYLLLNWLPLLLVGKGFTSDEASTVQLMFNVGGSTGALILGWLISRI